MTDANLFSDDTPEGYVDYDLGDVLGKPFTYDMFTQEQLDLLKVKGDSGSQILYGAGEPTASIGNKGDTYINTTSATWDIYYKSTATKWDKMGLLKPIDSRRLQIGDIILSTSVRTGWLECNGQVISRTEYAELFSKIGTKYGAGDGSTTFALPNYPPDPSYTLDGQVIQWLTPPQGVVRIIKAKEVN